MATCSCHACMSLRLYEVQPRNSSSACEKHNKLKALHIPPLTMAFAIVKPVLNIKQKPRDQRLLSQISAAAIYMYAEIHGREACLLHCIICVTS